MAAQIPNIGNASWFAPYALASQLTAETGAIEGRALSNFGHALGSGIASAAERKRAERRLAEAREDRLAARTQHERETADRAQASKDRLALSYLSGVKQEALASATNLQALKGQGAQVDDAQVQEHLRRAAEADDATRQLLGIVAEGKRYTTDRAPAPDDDGMGEPSIFQPSERLSAMYPTSTDAAPKVCADGSCDAEMGSDAYELLEQSAQRAAEAKARLAKAKTPEEASAASDLAQRAAHDAGVAKFTLAELESKKAADVKAADAEARQKAQDAKDAAIDARQKDRQAEARRLDIYKEANRLDEEARRLKFQQEKADKDRARRSIDARLDREARAAEAEKQREFQRERSAGTPPGEYAREAKAIDAEIDALKVQADALERAGDFGDAYSAIQTKIADLYRKKASTIRGGRPASTTEAAPASTESAEERAARIIRGK